MGSPWAAHLKHALVKPNPATITALVSVIYAVIFISSVVIFETVPPPPKPVHQRGLNFDQAWKDLQTITQHPHSYGSFANALVREYLHSRLSTIASQNPGVKIDDDLIIEGTGFDHDRDVHEADNLLVRIDGKNTSLPAVLFSAHYGSVSTGLGATNNGMGLVTLLQLIEYYATHEPKRTVIFNINKGKNDWLNGAHVFLDHEWSKLPATFLNLEGIGNGGRPVLSRTSSFEVTSSFRSTYRPYDVTPSSGTFRRRLVRNGTDVSVYESAGMRGLELALYRRQSRYHTVYGSAAWLGNKGSLWLMMENALDAGNVLVSAVTTSEATDSALFHILGSAVVIIVRPGIQMSNIILLLLGPIVVVIIVMTSPDGHREAWKRVKADKRLWMHAPAMLATMVVTTLGLAAIFAAANTDILYAYSFVVAISLISVAVLALIVPAKILTYYFPSTETTLLTTANHSVFTLIWWLLLCWPSGRLHVNSVGGPDYVTYAYTGQLLALILSLGSMLHLGNSPTAPNDTKPIIVNWAKNDETSSYTVKPHEQRSLPGRKQHSSVTLVGRSRCTWAAEILVSLLFPCILSSRTLIVLLTALSQALGDEDSPMTLYLASGLLSVLIALPIAPIASQLHRTAALFLALVFLGTTFHNLVVFPSSQLSSLDTSFKQSVDFDQGTNRVQPVTMSFTGLGKHISSARPSLIKCGYDRTDYHYNVDEKICTWVGPVPNTTLDSDPPVKWTQSSMSRVGSGADFDRQGRYTRSCRIYTTKIMKIMGDACGEWRDITESEGFEEIRLWSRTWDKPSMLYVTWAPESVWPRRGKIVCEWADWDAGQISHEHMEYFVGGRANYYAQPYPW